MTEAQRCPECNRVMSTREAAEQGACNDCHPGGAYSPDGLYPNYNDRGEGYDI